MIYSPLNVSNSAITFIQKGQIFLINPANGIEPLGIFRPVITEQDIICRQAEHFTDLD